MQIASKPANAINNVTTAHTCTYTHTVVIFYSYFNSHSIHSSIYTHLCKTSAWLSSCTLEWLGKLYLPNDWLRGIGAFFNESRSGRNVWIHLNQSFGKCSFPNRSSVQEPSHAECLSSLLKCTWSASGLHLRSNVAELASYSIPLHCSYMCSAVATLSHSTTA